MRHALRVDFNQAAIVLALRQAGCHVDIIGLPVDLRLAYVCSDGSKRFAYMEIKDGEKSPSRRKKTDVQEKFFKQYPESEGWPVCLVDSVEAALRAYRVLKS
jgi:hypothetical protein